LDMAAAEQHQVDLRFQAGEHIGAKSAHASN
jgi:hypothetical protein